MVHRTTVLILAAFVGVAAHAQKKPITIESLVAERRVTGLGPIEWAQDGKRFAWLERKELWLYDTGSGQRKVLVNLDALDAKAVKVAAPEVSDWTNRRVSEQRFAWSESGNEILISSSGDLFLLHVDTGKWDQLTATADAERDAKLSPDGHRVSFRREHDLYSLEIASGKTVRLTRDGSDTLL